MQYLDVVVNSKTDRINQVFTYKVSPELLPQIKAGVLIKIPFGNRNKEGIILSLKHLNTGTSKHKLKYINKIIDPVPIIDNIRLQLAKWMSRYYLTSLAKVIFFMVPDVARREVKKNDIVIQGYKDISQKLHDTRYTLHESKIYGLYNSKQSCIRNYIQLIQKARDKNKGVILLFPDWQANKIYIDMIYERFKNDTILLDPHKTKTEFFRSWNELRTGKKSIVIGTRNSIFAPVDKLGLIIIDEPEDFGYKEEQTVHYHVREVSKYLAKITGANLIYGSSAIQLEDYYWQKLGKIKVLKHSDVRKNVGVFNKILLVDGSQEKSLMGYQIEQKIIAARKENKKVLIFTNRKSQGFLCVDCGNIFRCPRCNNVLQYQTNSLKCSKCNHQENPPAQCPSCHGHNLRSFGTSVESINKELKKLFPNKNDITIATKEIFRHPETKFDLIVVPSWEHLQFGEDFNQKQSIINTIVKLLEITDDKLVIQTKNLDDVFLQNIAAGKIEEIYHEELQKRKKYRYPPFFRLIKFICKHRDSETAEKEIGKLYSKLKKISHTEILGPIEGQKSRGKFYWQIILKVPTEKHWEITMNIINQEKYLLISKYLVDVDPLKLI